MVKVYLTEKGETWAQHSAHDWRGTNPKDLKCANCGITSWDAKWEGRRCNPQWTTLSSGFIDRRMVETLTA